jgi:hypothetical protein
MRVEIIDISDVSGSMSCLRNDVIGGFNMLLHDQKKVPGEARYTHIQFDHEYNLLYAGKPIQDVIPLTTDTYAPRGSTALLDAIGQTLEEQGKRIHDENWADKVIVCIRTDGAENCSKKYTLPQIKAMIEHAQKHDWIFIFSGANQDAFQTASAYGISAQFTSNYVPTPSGMAQSYASTSGTIRSLRADPYDSLMQAKLAKTSQV